MSRQRDEEEIIMPAGLRKRLLVTLGLLLLASFIGLEALSYQRSHAAALREAAALAEEIRGVLMATRRVYHKQFLKSGIPLTDETLGFLPAHALHRIADDFPNWSDSGLTFNNVSDRPRNSKNAANSHELEDMAFFRDNPKEVVSLKEVQSPDGELYFHYARPIWVEEYCLRCHGKREEAPLTIRSNYEASFDYQAGELRGVLSITIPARQMTRRFQSLFYQDMAYHLAAFLIVYLALAWVIGSEGRREQ